MRSPDDSELEDPSLTSARELLAGLLFTTGEQGTLFGGYVLYEQLGRGGFGLVFRARRVGGDEAVALKQLRGGAHATAEERREFLAGAETTRLLHHDGSVPGIVEILEVGEIDNCPFFTMPLVDGGNLSAALELGQPSQAQAAGWMIRIALAVHHAHSSEVLHCDLKPANILLDKSGQPFVADFGSARRLSKEGHCVESGEGVLSYYMAPEQGTGDTRALTRRADIYSLGVILYELLTGQVPYEGLAFADWVAELVSGDPVRSPREIEPTLSPDLALICLKCLEKEPNRRYASAQLLAEDLGLVLAGGHPLRARPEGALSRGLRWARRYPLRSAIVGGAVLFGLVLLVSVFSLLQAEGEQQRSALETNAYIASSQAGALLFQLREFADRTDRCGQKPGVKALLVSGAVNETTSALESCARGFQAVYLTSLDGRLLAQWPPPSNAVLGKNYAFREYYLGARYLGERGLHSVFLGPAYRAESNGQLQFAVAAPVFDQEGVWLGSVVAAQAADSAIGQVRLQDSIESGRTVALLGPRGRDRFMPDAPASKAFDFIVHPRLGLGHEVAIQDPIRARLDQAFGASVTPGEQFSLRWAPPLLLADYRDPLVEQPSSSLAAFAPVGQTGYVVVVHTSKDALRRDARALVTQLAWRAAMPLAAGLLLLGWAVLSTAWRKRSLEMQPRRHARSRRAGRQE